LGAIENSRSENLKIYESQNQPASEVLNVDCS
jgi:hypothetical protein